MDVRNVLDSALLYRLWQAPFAGQKFRPVVRHNDLSVIGRVLDVGCGPGTNTRQFEHTDYLGVDLNPRYIEAAAAKYGQRFQVADVTTGELQLGGFDFVLSNSLLHHLAEAEVARLLQRIGMLLTNRGEVHILDLVLPSSSGIGRWLAMQDRGQYSRSLEHWRELFESHFETVVFEPYSLRLLGVPLWQMVYFKGRRKST